MTVIVPETIRAADLAIKLGWSARRLKSLAREIGACPIMGNRMVLTQSDVDAILDATKPKPVRPAMSAAGPLMTYEHLKKFRAVGDAHLTVANKVKPK
jgi:hypothetical protein